MGWGIKGQAERLSAFSFVCNKGGKGAESWTFSVCRTLVSREGCRPLQPWGARHVLLKGTPHLSSIQRQKDAEEEKGGRHWATFICKRIAFCMRFLKSIFSHQINWKKTRNDIKRLYFHTTLISLHLLNSLSDAAKPSRLFICFGNWGGLAPRTIIRADSLAEKRLLKQILIYFLYQALKCSC